MLQQDQHMFLISRRQLLTLLIFHLEAFIHFFQAIHFL